MKFKVLALMLCTSLVLFVFAGCGLKMPTSSNPSPKSSNNSAGGAADVRMVTGFVSAIGKDTITVDIVKQNDRQSSGDTGTINVGSSVYVKTGATYLVTPANNTPVILENQSYTYGLLGDIAMGDFLAVAIRDDAAVAIIDGGQPGASGTNTDKTDSDTDTVTSPEPSDNPTNNPTDKPTDNGEPSPAVSDSSAPVTYKVTTDGLKVRSAPDTTSSVLGVLDTGARETGTVSNGWLKFTYNGKTAYCSAEFLTVSTVPDGIPDSSKSQAYITTSDLAVREGPGTTYAILGTLAKGTKATGTVADGWLKFTYNGSTAYCSASYLAKG